MIGHINLVKRCLTPKEYGTMAASMVIYELIC